MNTVKSLKVENFTILPNATFEFSPNLNIIVAENAAGKSHLLKILYALLEVTSNEKNRLLKTDLQKIFANKLLAVFRSDSLGRLVKRQNKSSRAELLVTMNSEHTTHLDFSNHATTQVNIQSIPNEYNDIPAFIPTRELITLAPWLPTLYDKQIVPFEETWIDTCRLLNLLVLKGPKAEAAKKLLKPLENAMGDKVIMDNHNGRFYLGKLEAPLVAEGMRKFMMIAHLVATGSLLDKGYLFWDEPESNLNPKLIKVAAEIIFELSQQNIQVFIATHSLFLLRELEILQKNQSQAHYFSLVKNDDGLVQMQQGERLDDLDTIVALDENLAQSERYLQL